MLHTIISGLSLSHTRRVVTLVLHLAGARPSPLHVRAALGAIGEIEKLGICVICGLGGLWPVLL